MIAGSSHSEVDFPWIACFGVEDVVCFDCPTSIHLTFSQYPMGSLTGILLSHWTHAGGLFMIKVPCPLLGKLLGDYVLYFQFPWVWLTLQPFLDLQVPS